jgi:ABC-2 type transport system permease protein
VEKMINFTLFKQGIKSNYKVFLIFIAILTMYISIIISMYDPVQASALAEFYNSMPEIMNTLGMSGDTSSLIGFIISYLYGFFFMLFPMVAIIMFANRLVAAHTDKGSMAYLMASPNSRGKIIFTQMKVLCTFIAILVFYITTLSIIICSVKFPGELDIGNFIILNLGLLLLQLAISGICFLASVIFNETKNSLLIGAGIPVMFFLMQMLSNAGDKLENMKYFTILTLFEPRGIIENSQNSYLMIGALAVIAAVLYFISFKIFEKRDLPI